MSKKGRIYYCGKPIEEMTREELIEALEWTGQRVQQLLDDELVDIRSLSKGVVERVQGWRGEGWKS